MVCFGKDVKNCQCNMFASVFLSPFLVGVVVCTDFFIVYVYVTII
jgi:hypothetical protein